MNIDYNIYEKTRYPIMAMIALQPSNEDEEREAIFSVLDNNHKIEVTYKFSVNIIIELHLTALRR